MMQKKDDIVKFKILLIGTSGVGKTSLLMKFIHNKFSYDYQVTSGIQFSTKQIQINEKTTVGLQIWDTMGQQAFKSLVKSYYKGVSAVIFIYSIEKKETFDKLDIWTKQVRENVHDQTVFYVVGSKLDLQEVRKVSFEQGEKYKKQISAVGFTQISSKTGQNVKQLFDKLSKSLFKKYQSSKAFKQLVKPFNPGMAKSESFRLKVEDYRNTQKRGSQKGCC